jgi:hypothetical protein
VAVTYDITTPRGRVRFNLADTDSGAYVFEDAEIDQMLSTEGDAAGATVACIRALLADRGRRAKRFSMQGLSLDDTAQIQALRELLALYGGDLPSVAIVMPDLLPMDQGFDEPVIL